MAHFRYNSGINVPNYDNISQPPKERLKHKILDMCDGILAEILSIEKRKGRNLTYSTHRLRAYMLTLTESIYTSLRASLPKETLTVLDKKINSTNYADLKTGWRILNEFLYKKNLIAFDTGQNIDFNDMEAENESQGQ